MPVFLLLHKKVDNILRTIKKTNKMGKMTEKCLQFEYHHGILFWRYDK